MVELPRRARNFGHDFRRRRAAEPVETSMISRSRLVRSFGIDVFDMLFL
jgi:hypothetical protein